MNITQNMALTEEWQRVTLPRNKNCRIAAVGVPHTHICQLAETDKANSPPDGIEGWALYGNTNDYPPLPLPPTTYRARNKVVLWARCKAREHAQRAPSVLGVLVTSPLS